jgi:hypothetical protein
MHWWDVSLPALNNFFIVVVHLSSSMLAAIHILYKSSYKFQSNICEYFLRADNTTNICCEKWKYLWKNRFHHEYAFGIIMLKLMAATQSLLYLYHLNFLLINTTEKKKNLRISSVQQQWSLLLREGSFIYERITTRMTALFSSLIFSYRKKRTNKSEKLTLGWCVRLLRYFDSLTWA